MTISKLGGRSPLWALLLCAGVAACGGGGSDGGSAASPAAAADAASPAAPAPAPSPAPAASPAPAPAAPAPAPAAPAPAAPAPAPAPAPAAPASVGSTCGITNFQATILARINALRAAGADCRTAGSFAPAAALTWSTQLTQSAEAHSQDMVAKNYFSHTGSDGSTMADRVNATGYAWSSLGENIAAGYAGIDAVLAGWMGSDGHCANIMNPSFDQIGLVCVAGTSATTYGNYWTMDAAKSR